MPRTSRSAVRPPAPRLSEIVRDHGDLLLAVAAGGALGSLGRWALAELIPHDAGGFAWSTLAVNVTGALLAGLLLALVVDAHASARYLRPFLGVGVLGGWTTFSAYADDARAMLAAGDPMGMLRYVGGTLLLGLVAVWAGLLAGRILIAAAGRRS